jgi:hypothetical protein
MESLPVRHDPAQAQNGEAWPHFYWQYRPAPCVPGHLFAPPPLVDVRVALSAVDRLWGGLLLTALSDCIKQAFNIIA